MFGLRLGRAAAEVLTTNRRRPRLTPRPPAREDHLPRHQCEMQLLSASRAASRIGIVFALSLYAVRAHAQIRHPNIVAFQPSVDQDAIGADGQPLVRRYELEISRAGSMQLLLTINLGKPAPDADGYVRVIVEDQVNTAALTGLTLEARVAAVGASGTSRSAASNVFAVDVCRYLTPGSIEIAGTGTAVETTVVAPNGCGWQVRSTGFPMPETSAGAGRAHLRIGAAANHSQSARVGAVSVGSEVILVFQSPGE